MRVHPLRGLHEHNGWKPGRQVFTMFSLAMVLFATTCLGQESASDKVTDMRRKAGSWVKTEFNSSRMQIRLAQTMQALASKDPEQSVRSFTYETESYKCQPSAAGSVFNSSSYSCSAKCEVFEPDSDNPLAVLHKQLVEETLPTMHALRSLKHAMSGRAADEDGDVNDTEDPIGGIAFVVNYLHEAESPFCALWQSEVFSYPKHVFGGLATLAKRMKDFDLSKKVSTIGSSLYGPVKSIDTVFKTIDKALEEGCRETSRVHAALLVALNTIATQLAAFDGFLGLLIDPMLDGSCMSANVFTVTDDLVERLAQDKAAEEATPNTNSIGTFSAHVQIGGSNAKMPMHERRNHAASMTPHPRHLPLRRMLMHSDWEQEQKCSADPDFPGQCVVKPRKFERLHIGTAGITPETVPGIQSRSFKSPANAASTATDGLESSIDAINNFLGVVEELDDVLRGVGRAWVDAHVEITKLFKTFGDLFDKLDGFMPFFDLIFEIGGLLDFGCPDFLGKLCSLGDIIDLAVEELKNFFKDLFGIDFDALMKNLLDLLLPDIDFELDLFNSTIAFPSLFATPPPWERLEDKAVDLVQDVLEPLLEDPLNLLFLQDPTDTSGLDVLYKGIRGKQTVGIEDCAGVYDNDRLPLLFHGIQRSAWCPAGYDFTASSRFPCGFPTLEKTGDDCVVSSINKVDKICVNGNYPHGLDPSNFPEWLGSGPRDYYLQAHYVCATEETVTALDFIPQEASAQGTNTLTCSTKSVAEAVPNWLGDKGSCAITSHTTKLELFKRFSVDVAVPGVPCKDQSFKDSGNPEDDFSNKKACQPGGIDETLGSDGSTQLQWYEALREHQRKLMVDIAGNGHINAVERHMEAVNLLLDPASVHQGLSSVIPDEVKGYYDLDAMTEQHLDPNQWKTGFGPNVVFKTPVRSSGKRPRRFGHSTSGDKRLSGHTEEDTTRGGENRTRGLERLSCADGSYLEKIKYENRRKRYGKSIVSDSEHDDRIRFWFKCYGESEETEYHKVPSSADDDDFYSENEKNLEDDNVVITDEDGKKIMDCSGLAGGFRSIEVERQTDGDKERWILHKTCMNSTAPPGKAAATCPADQPVMTGLEAYWFKDIAKKGFRDRLTNDYSYLCLNAAHCSESPLHQSRDFTSSGFEAGTPVGDYVTRKNLSLDDAALQTPRCERHARAQADKCNFENLEQADDECHLDESECGKSVVKYFCPVPGIDMDLPFPELVANSFGSNALKGAVVSCPAGQTYQALQVVQGEPGGSGQDAMDEFEASGCDGKTSTCTFVPADGFGARVVYQCLCGEGHLHLPDESGLCEYCPEGTERSPRPLSATSARVIAGGTYGGEFMRPRRRQHAVEVSSSGPASLIPGNIEAELFDNGGDGVAYKQTDLTNKAQTFRPSEAVGLKEIENGNYLVGWNHAGEWLRYTVFLPHDVARFNFRFVVGSWSGDKSFQVVADPTDEGDPCGTYRTDLSGLVTDLPVTNEEGPQRFVTKEVDTSSTNGIGGLSRGANKIWLCFVKASGNINIDSFQLILPDGAPAAQGPYGGAPPVPGSIEAENFDFGGEGVAYSQTSATNRAQTFRSSEAVGLEEIQDGNHLVGWNWTGEWLRYTVSVSQNVARFNFRFVVSSWSGEKSFRVIADPTNEGDPCGTYRTDLSGLVTDLPVTNEGGAPSFAAKDVDTSSINGIGGLSAGPAKIWLCFVKASGNVNIDSFELLLPEEDSFGGTVATIPGSIEAEQFDLGIGMGYHDTTPGNSGEAFRPFDDVDIYAGEDSYHVGDIAVGEWLRYTVEVTHDVSRFDLEVVAASPSGEGSFQVVANPSDSLRPCDTYETDISGVVTDFTATGDDFLFAVKDVDTSSVKNVGGLPAGPAEVWLCVVEPGFNIDSFSLMSSPDNPSSIASCAACADVSYCGECELPPSCVECPSGTYGTTDASSGARMCEPCPKNTFSDQIGAIDKEACTPCLDGYYTVGDSGASSREECVACGVNFECIIASHGEVSGSVEGATAGDRNACPPGFWTAGSEISTACVACPPGTHYTNGQNTGGTCEPCAPGTFSNHYGEDSCQPCSVGTYHPGPTGNLTVGLGATSCHVCDIGYYQDKEQSLECTRCDPRKPNTFSVGSTRSADCLEYVAPPTPDTDGIDASDGA